MNAPNPASTLMRINATGDRMWSRSLGDQLQHVVGTTDGGVILGGCANGAPGFRLFKYDGNGNRLWEKHHLFSHSDTLPPQLRVTRILIRDTGAGAQELHIVGWRMRDGNSRHADGFLIRCDDAGNVINTVSFNSPTFTHWVPLEAGDPNAPMTFPQWADYWNLPTHSQTSDADNDGRSNSQEWFFGGDPSTTENGLPQLGIAQSGGNLIFTTTRSKAASGLAPAFQTSIDLSLWDPLATGHLNIHPLNLFTDQLTFEIPLTSEPRRFYRVGAP